MALQIRRGTDADRQTITPLSGELIFTTDTKELYVGDGSTAGGVAIQSTSSGGSTGITEVVNDTSPQLGGDLDVNNFQITSASGNVMLAPASGSYLHLGSGATQTHRVGMYDRYFFPATVPTTGQVLTAGNTPNQLEWQTPSTSSGGGATALSALTDVDVSGAINGSVLKYNTTSSTWEIGTDNVGSGGGSFDQSLNTTDNVTFASVQTDSMTTSTTGTPTITSSSNIHLQATGSVVIQQGGFRLPNLTTTARNQLAASNGEMVYNTTVNRIQAYQNGSWINIDDGSAA